MAPPPLSGIHHVSAVTGRASENVRFYTQLLGMRFVLKTVNQDDPSSYHLFYGDETGAPGTELTFFDVAHARQQRRGTGLITGTSLRVRGPDALEHWTHRLDEKNVRRSSIHQRAGRPTLTLYDPEGQPLHLVDDSGDVDRVPDTTPWEDGPVPTEVAIRGLGPVELTVSDLAPTRQVLTEVLSFSETRPYDVVTESSDRSSTDGSLPSLSDANEASVFETGPGGVAAELHVVESPDAPQGWLGRGGVHHVALRTPNSETIQAWRDRIAEAGLNPSPVIDRHFFESVYVREPGGILIEIATDTGAPFPYEDAEAGILTLPPSLEPNRNEIEAALTPIESDVNGTPS